MLSPHLGKKWMLIALAVTSTSTLIFLPNLYLFHPAQSGNQPRAIHIERYGGLSPGSSSQYMPVPSTENPAARAENRNSSKNLRTYRIVKPYKSRPHKREEHVPNIRTQGKVQVSYSNITGLQKRMGMFQTDAMMCRESPVVLCGRNTQTNSRHKSTNSSQILAEEMQTGTTNHWVSVGNSSAAYLNQPIKISIVNLPKWLEKQFLHAQQIRNETCLFDNGPITSEIQIVGVVGPGLREEHKPSQRWPGQIYVLMGWETPYYFDSSFTDVSSVWDDQFNATMGYREDSDIFLPYATLTFSPKSPSQLPNYFEIAAQKTHQVIIFVSNCRTQSRRGRYVQELRKYIDVDVFGACGESMSCPKAVDLECVENVILDYRFYLSFENSLCPDYVTEKLFKVFAHNKHIIPVVRGGAEYKLWLPENTFIDAADFASAKDLAMFLLNMDTETYSRYLATKDLYKMDITIDHVLENLCDAFTQPDRKVSFRSNVKQWFLNYTCYEPNDFPKDD